MKRGLITFFLIFLNLMGYGQSLQLKLYQSEENAPIKLNGNFIQDSKGFFWFVERNSILKYNGKSFIEVTNLKSDSTNYFTKIFEIDNKILLQTEKGIRQIIHDSIHLMNWSNNNITNNIDLVKYLDKLYLLSKNGLFILKNDSFNLLINTPELKNIENRSNLFFINDSLAITFSYNKNIILLNINSKKVYEINIPAIGLLKSKGEFYYFTYDKGLEKLKNISIRNNKPYFDSELIKKIKILKSKIFTFYRDQDDNFWLTSEYDKLIKIDKEGTIYNYDEKSGLTSLWITNITEDREGNIWLSYFPGLCKIFKNNNIIYNTQNGLYSNISKSLTIDKSTNTFIVVNGKGINRVSKNNLTNIYLENKKPVISNSVLLYKDILYSINDYELCVYKLKKDILYNKKTILKFDKITFSKLIEDKGEIYFTRDTSLYQIINFKPILLFSSNQIIKDFTIDKNNHFWIITMDKLIYEYTYNKFHLQLYKKYNMKTELNLNNFDKFRSIITDDYNNIWVNSSDIYIYKYDRFENKWFYKNIITDNNRYSDIWNISETKDKIYISTSVGLKSIFVNDKNLNVHDESKNTKIYNSRQIISLENGWSCSSNTMNISLFNYKDSSQNFTHDVLINYLTVNGVKKYLDSDEVLYLRNNQNNISFVISSNSFLNENANAFSYSLSKDTSSNWSPFQSNNIINFNALSPGKYVFKVKAINEQKKLSENIAVSSFIIKPAFWQTNWFILLLVIIPLSIIYLIFRYRLLQLKKLQIIRNNISRDLHDQLGSSISSISMLSNIALKNIQNNIAANKLLEQISKTAIDAGECIDDIVWANNPKFDNSLDTFSRIRNTTSELLDVSGISYTINFPESANCFIDNQLRRDIYLIFKEAVTNIIKYSKANHTNLIIELTSKNINIQIDDDGIGFDISNALKSNRNGIKNLYHRVNNYKKGKIEIISELNHGTKILISLPI